MAPGLPLKRKRGTVSYREPSSDEDFSTSDLESASRKRPARRSTRHLSTELEQASTTSSRRVASQKSSSIVANRSSRRRRERNISYRDVDTDEDSEEADDEDFEAEEVVAQPTPRKLPTSPPSKLRKRSRVRPSKVASPKVRALGAALKNKSTPQPSTNARLIPTDGNKPDMAALPFHVLLQIFVYASHPLHDGGMQPTDSIPWLVRMASMCSTFTTPALTALYRNPPIFALKQNRRKLVHHLITPPASAREDYKVMVKRLELDATQMTALTDTANSVTDLTSLVAALSTLKEIEIYDPLDRPPYRPRLRRIRRWYYPDELFSTLRQGDLRLQSWRWNCTYCLKGLLWVKEIHADGAFQSLRELTFVRFNKDERRKQSEATDPTTEELLGSAIAVLPNLRSLAFESCATVNGQLLPLLPSSLLSLSITNCINLTSEDLQAFLSNHGRRLEELVLNHNQSLDLSFLVGLKHSCPRLEVLKMDLNYYSSLVMSSDNEPLYDWLLGLDEIPTWPTTLQVLDLEYLRNWGSISATNFFASLVTSAAELPMLRELRILTMVDDMAWRERADFRRKWEARFQKVFARRCPPPSPHLASLRAFRDWKASQDETVERNDSILDNVEGGQNDAAPGIDSESDSDIPLLTRRQQKQNEKWGTKRLRSRAKGSTNYEETSEGESHEGEISEAASDDGDQVIQGRCHTVMFRIDNLRPREELYDEGDFLDDERSGDEDWDGNDDVDDGYAW